MRSLSLPSKRRVTSCSVLALATVLVVGATPAAAQSFLGNGTVTSGTGSITTGPSTTNISVTTPQTVIDWIPTDNAIANNTAIAFQNSGTTASFSGPSAYAVLNRINPADSTRNILLNGTIQTVAAGAGGGGNGSIYFYSPGGFVIGANAVINVGSLVLSASPITVTAGNFIGGFGTTNTVVFGPAVQAGAQVRTTLGSQITAYGGDAYVAMVAPRVDHRGSINVSGSAALVGAEAATINFSPSGLFDIQVTAGTTDGTGVYNSGTITGSASTGAADIHRAYLVAVPKNTALTMVIASGSNLGFDVAGAANVVGNTVVLSAGHDISGGSIGSVSAGTVVPGTVANLQVNDGTYTSAVNAEATGYAHLSAFSAMHFFSDLNVHADGEIWLSTQAAGATLDVDRNLSLSTWRSGNSGQSVSSSDISVYNGGSGGGAQLTVDGSTTINTSAYGGWSSATGVDGGNGTAGDVFITATYGSDVDLAGGLTVYADGVGGGAFGAGVDGGVGTGGKVSIYTIGDNSHLTITGPTSISADGTGGSGNGGECFVCDGSGGDGFGGTFLISTESAATLASTITFNGSVNATVNGYGGTAADGFSGDGNGGTATMVIGSLDTIAVNGSLAMAAAGQGGVHYADMGGTGTGGLVSIHKAAAATSGTITITGDLELSSDGTGGAAYGSGNIGGTGFGGTGAKGSYIAADAIAITVGGATNVHSDAIGGASDSGDGGYAKGGNIDIFATNNGNLLFDGDLTVSADAEGGIGATGGGNADGGDVGIASLATLQVDGALTARANAIGGGVYFTDTSGFDGGDAFGGNVDVYAQNGTLTLVGGVILSTEGTGGSAENSFDNGGNGEGGVTRLFANSGGSVDLQSGLDSSAVGTGGGGGYLGAGGHGKGGDVRVQATGANASVTVAGAATLDASGEGSASSGGNGTGGTVWTDSFGAATASLDFLSDVALYAQGQGGDHNNGTGGNGQGGQALLQASAGSILTVGGDAIVNTDAFGGFSYDFSDGVGGNATGGESRIQTFGGTGSGGTITIDGSATVSADGFGGDVYGGFGAQGGNGTGGSAHIITTLGTIKILGADPGFGGEVLIPADGAYVSADGYGGDAAGGTGGDGTAGGFAYIEAFNGDIEIAGLASISASGYGGDGKTGGNGVGGGEEIIEPDSSVTIIDGARILARNGDIVVGGGAIASATGVGGDGGYDNGYGGDYGGDGGDGIGGYARILAQNSDLGPSSITIVSGALESSGFAAINVDGTGGDGGDGNSGNIGSNGGNGGTGIGGAGSIAAAAGNGHVTIDQAIGYARGRGGDGGNGGNGDGGAGGKGGKGGNGFGGSIAIGTLSGNPQSGAVNNGVGDYGTITADASAWGGQGGNGNFGATNGNGGNGGKATGGNALLIVRGSTVNVDTATLTADATGGDGGYLPGFGGFNGIGGDATVGGDGGIGVEVTGRYLIPAQRGMLNAGDISGTAIATSGIGIPNGNSKSLGGSGVVFFNGDGNIGSLDFLIGLGSNGSASGIDSISVINGDVDVDGEFSFVTPGNLSLFANNGDMHAGILTLSAGNFVFDPANDPPSNRGTYFADSATITTGNNFVTSANLDIGSDLEIIAPGLINAQKFTIDGDLDLRAQGGGITATILDVNGRTDLNAAGSILISSALTGFFHAEAGGSFTSGNITSDSNIQIFTGDDVILGNLIAGQTADIDSNKAIRIISGGSVLVQNINAIGGIDITAAGSVDGDNVTTGDVLFTDALGAIHYDNVSAGLVNPQVPTEPFSVGLVSGASISVGNVNALRSIGLIATGLLTSGNLTSTTDVLGLAEGNMSLGAINAGGRVLLADYSMYTNAGGTIPTSDGFDPELVFGATPVASSGSILVNGPISAGSLQAAAGTSFSSGNIVADGLISITAGTSIGTGSITNTGNTSLNAGTSINVGSIDSGAGAVSLITGTSFISGSFVTAGSIYADSGSDIFLANLTAAGDIELVAVGDILVGNALAGEAIDFDAGGYVDGGNMTAGDTVEVAAGTYVDLLDVSAGLVDQSTAEGAEYNVGILAGTTIETGDIEAFNHIGLAAQGNIYTGSIDAGGIFLALGGGNMSFGTISAGNQTYLAHYSMMALGGELADSFDPAPILAATPVASGGSIALRSAVNTGRFEAAAGTTLTGTTINANGLLYATSGGNMTLGNLNAGNDVRLTSGGNIVTGSIDSGDDVALIAAGSISTLDIFAYDDVSADAGTTITTDDITGSTIDLFADGNISTGDLLTQDFFQGEFQLVDGASITVQSGGDVDTGTIDSKDGVYVSANGTISTETIDAEDFVQLVAGGNITAGTITAGDYIDIDSDTGSLELADLDSGNQIELDAAQSIDFGDATALSFDFDAGGAVTGGNIVAVNNASGSAEGAITLENITVTGPPIDDDFSIGFSSATSITVENVDGFDRVGFATLGNLTTGNITAGSLFITLVGGDVVTGSITTDADGQVYMADASMCGGGCGGDDDEGDVEVESVLALAPVPTGGSILINGPVSTGRFQAASEGNFTAHAIDADSLDVTSQATATIDGMWSVPDVSLVSRDINITANGGIDGGSAGLVTLNAVHDGGGALIGDGLTGTGYALSNAEFGRISSGTIRIVVGGNGGDADTLIGDLTITGPLAGSNIESSDGGVEFITLQEDGAALDGTLRVVGDVVASGFGADNYIGFYTQNFELDAATGLISITGNGGALAGTLELYASRIHVAEGSLLDQLAANPQFAGYREALNKQAAVQRPDGVIRAANFDIEFGGSDNSGPYTLFVQNMGTTTVPAGFLLNAANIGDDGEGSVAAGSIDMAINGQIKTEGGTLTGVAVRDFLVTEFGTEPFAPGSTINGCPLVGTCSAAPPRVDTPTRTDVPLTGNNGLGDGLFGNEPDIAGESDGDSSSPIAAPNPLFDSRPLGASDDVDDPVSGAGNPSLYGASSEEDSDVEVCDNKKDKKCKTNAKGDGK